MRSFARVLHAELMKVRWWSMAVILAVAPALVFLTTALPESGTAFSDYYMQSIMMYGWLFYPLLAGIIAALVCRTEHLSGGWKQTLSMPVRRTDVYLAKYLIVAGLLAASQLLLLGVILVRVGLAGDAIVDMQWSALRMGLFSGWVAVLPLAALQLWVSTRWKAFGAPLALNVAFTIPALFAVQSADYGPWYPWGQPFLGMMLPFAQQGSNEMLAFSTETLLYVILGGFIVWMLAGVADFARADVDA